MSGAGGKKRKMSMHEFDEEGATWECTVCTFRNRFEAFKCEMCDTRKGTSTRKPKLNENVVEKQQFVQNFVVQQSLLPKLPKRRTHMSAGSPSTSRHSPESTSSGSVPPRTLAAPTTPQKTNRKHVPIPDALIYRTSPKKHTITVKGVTVVLTEFRSKPGVILDKELITKSGSRPSTNNIHPPTTQAQSVQ